MFHLSSAVWECMVSKVQTDFVSMSPVSGANGKSRFVVSFRNPDSPLKVQAGKSLGQYSCDKKKCHLLLTKPVRTLCYCYIQRGSTKTMERNGMEPVGTRPK